ncbi:hypothetical protein LY76DRAFT_524734, partial [Colletotrichum caudatum]
KGYLGIVKLLLNNGDITIVNEGGWTPLNSASNNGHLEVVKLFSQGFEGHVRKKNNNGRKALFYAAMQGH